MPHALHVLVVTVAGWLNRHQEDLIDYLLDVGASLALAFALTILGERGT